MTTTGTYYPPAAGTGGFLSNPPFMNTPNRDEQHGGIQAVGAMSQSLKIIIRDGYYWHSMNAGRQEALDLIAHKLGCILSGNDPHNPHHWEDMARYAQAAMREVQP